MRIWLLDHHDSFTLNIREWLLVHPAVSQVCVVAYDDASGMAEVASSVDPIVLGPGPKDPAAINATWSLVCAAEPSRPILGICLGHQLLAAIAGAPIVRAKSPLHGVAISLEGDAELCGGCVAIYNSLVVGRAPVGYRVTARNADGEIMAIAATDASVKRWGWQFHPESFLTAHGRELGNLFVAACSDPQPAVSGARSLHQEIDVSSQGRRPPAQTLVSTDG